MKIGIIYYGGYPWDRGIDQLAQCLKQSNLSPIIFASEVRSKKQENVVNGIPVVYVPQFQKNNILNRIKAYHFPFNPYWRNWLVDMGLEYSLDAMIVRESILSWPVLSACKKLNIKPFMDMRENISAMYRMHNQNKGLFRQIFRHPSLVKAHERYNIENFEHIFTVSKELKCWLKIAYNLTETKISVLENTPSSNFIQLAQKACAEKQQRSDVIRLVYAGIIKRPKGIGDVVEAIPYVLKKNSNIRLRIIGDGPFLKELKKRVYELSISEFVEFFPLLSIAEYIKSLNQCDIGLETCWLNELTNLTVPGKLFEYMALGLPIFSSSRLPVKRILVKRNCGIVYESNDPEMIAESLLLMVEDEKQLKQMAKNARTAIIDRYNSQRNVRSLKSIFKL